MWKTSLSSLLIILAAFGVQAQIMDIQLANEYYQKGDLEKAKALYDVLAQEARNIPQINSNYLEILKQKGEPSEIRKYFARLTEWYPGNLTYKVDIATFYFETGDQKTYDKLVGELKDAFATNRFQLSMLGQLFASKRMFDPAVDFFLLARRASDAPTSYALELARIYSLQNNKERMVDEYLTYAQESRQNAAYIKNIFQNLLSEEGDLTYLEQALLKRMQKEPEERTYPDMMIWVELQRKNFYGAFVQARAVDKREQGNGNETMRVGRIAMDNGSWEHAITIFDYLSKTYTDGPVQAYYRKILIEAKEGRVKNMYPVNRAEIKALSAEYRRLYEELGPNPNTFEALRNLAHLHAFYLNEIDTAAIVLRYLINTPRVSRPLVAQSKMDLGDIYLLKNEPWEATLLYSQVEKEHRDSPLAYEAKLKNARLHYFTGNFKLAKSHLDILKRATTREISNDAIDISVLIADNTYLDSTDVVMQEYAHAQLLIFQKRFREAKTKLQQMQTKHQGHSILDEVYWQQAIIHQREGEFVRAIELLEKIRLEFGYDILADDATFKIAEITERDLGDAARAQQLYQDFLTTYPGSMYAAEARARFRKLRGDFTSESVSQ